MTTSDSSLAPAVASVYGCCYDCCFFFFCIVWLVSPRGHSYYIYRRRNSVTLFDSVRFTGRTVNNGDHINYYYYLFYCCNMWRAAGDEVNLLALVCHRAALSLALSLVRIDLIFVCGWTMPGYIYCRCGSSLLLYVDRCYLLTWKLNGRKMWKS